MCDGFKTLRGGVKTSNIDRLNEIRENYRGTKMEIIQYISSDRIRIKFLDEYGFETDTTYSNFRMGSVKNPYDKFVFDVGYIGQGSEPSHIDGKNTPAYASWHNILERCYSEKYKNKYKSYYDICTVCDEWKCYQNYAIWYRQNKYPVAERLHLDKDILVPGNKLYSPETCLLVPQRINMLFMNRRNNKGLPNGISKVGNQFQAEYNTVILGQYTTLQEAFYTYAKAKKAKIIEVANEYKGIIPQKVYNAMLRYEVLIENDKNYVT